MRNICFFVLGCLAVSLASCSSKPRDLIVGKWKTTDGKNGGLEFTKDAMSFDTGPNQPADGKKGQQYRFIDENNVETGDGKVRFKVAVTKDELTITAPDTPSENQLLSFVEGKIVLQLPPPRDVTLKLKRVN